VCDGNILAGAGLPTLDTAGAIGGALHTYDEYLVSASLVQRSKLAALFLMKLANNEIVLY
jgi:glutamate carboxypeptidase